MATQCCSHVPAGNKLAKQRKKQQEDSDVFPKLGKITGGTILRHQIDDTYSRSSYSKSYDTSKAIGATNHYTRPQSGRRNRPHPRKDWLMWRLPENSVRMMTMTDDAGLFSANYGWDGSSRFETEYSRLYGGKEQSTNYSERKRLLNREEIAKASLPCVSKEPEMLHPSSPTEANQQSADVLREKSYSDLNKFLGSDIWRDKEVVHQILETGDKRYLIKFLKTLSPETLLGLQKWLQAKDEDKECEDMGEATPTKNLVEGSQETEATLLKDQINGDKECKNVKTSEGGSNLISNLIDSANQKEIAKFLSTIIEPKSVRGITHWLVSHEEKEREIALRFLGEVRFKPSKDQAANDKCDVPECTTASLTKRSKKKRSPHGKNCSCTVCDADHSNRILRALYNQGSSSVIDEMRRALECVPRPKKSKVRKQTQRKNQVARLGGDNRLKRVQGHLPNTNALFMQPHRVLPSFFVIHPELP